MTEDEYISALKSHWPTDARRDRETSRLLIALADSAVGAFPGSARLWVYRGNLLELAAEDSGYPLEESLACYKRAIELDPKFAEAWGDTAHFYDAVLADEVAAVPYFREFERLQHHHLSE